MALELRSSLRGARIVARLVVSRTVWPDSADTPQRSPPVISNPSSPPMPGFVSTWCSGRTVHPHNPLPLPTCPHQVFDVLEVVPVEQACMDDPWLVVTAV